MNEREIELMQDYQGARDARIASIIPSLGGLVVMVQGINEFNLDTLIGGSVLFVGGMIWNARGSDKEQKTLAEIHRLDLFTVQEREAGHQV